MASRSACLFLLFLVPFVALANPSLQELLANDLLTLNYALTLENFEYAFYSHFLSIYNNTEFGNFGGSTTYNYLLMIRAHESAHVGALGATITQFGGTPNPPCSYNWNSIGSVNEFIATAVFLENAGVGAYDGAINTIYNKTLMSVASTIATVEARHAAFLQYVGTAINPDPSRSYPFANFSGDTGKDAFDAPTSPAEVLEIVKTSGMITSCSYDISAIPEVLTIDLSIQQGANPTQEQANENDLLTLNFALTLEHLEATFYATFQGVFNSSDFASIGLDPVYDYTAFNLIAAHEASHVTFLTNTIASLGGSPVAACIYNWGFNFSAFDVANPRTTAVELYIYLARVFENFGVTAYDGAITTLTNQVLIEASASIATVEARHASYLNYLNVSYTSTLPAGPFYANGNPFPGAFDAAVDPAAILAAVSNFITSCPAGSPQLPSLYYLTPTNITVTQAALTTTGSTTATTGTSTTGLSTTAGSTSGLGSPAVNGTTSSITTGTHSTTGSAASHGLCTLSVLVCLFATFLL